MCAIRYRSRASSAHSVKRRPTLPRNSRRRVTMSAAVAGLHRVRFHHGNLVRRVPIPVVVAVRVQFVVFNPGSRDEPVDALSGNSGATSVISGFLEFIA